VTKRSRSATTVGVLFIIATVFFMMSKTLIDPVLGAPNYLDTALAAQRTLIAGMLVGLTGALSIPLIPAFMFPVYGRGKEAWALAYLAMRTIEALLLVISLAMTLSMLDLSAKHVEGAAGAAELTAIGAALQSTGEWAFALSVGLVFPLGALIFYGLLYRQRLVPAWLSVWGFASAVLLLVGSVLLLLELTGGVSEATLEAIVTGPIALNEMVLAVWLIAKGFNVNQ
jgi:hypothetical protein